MHCLTNIEYLIIDIYIGSVKSFCNNANNDWREMFNPSNKTLSILRLSILLNIRFGFTIKDINQDDNQNWHYKFLRCHRPVKISSKQATGLPLILKCNPIIELSAQHLLYWSSSTHVFGNLFWGKFEVWIVKMILLDFILSTDING